MEDNPGLVPSMMEGDNPNPSPSSFYTSVLTSVMALTSASSSADVISLHNSLLVSYKDSSPTLLLDTLLDIFYREADENIKLGALLAVKSTVVAAKWKRKRIDRTMDRTMGGNGNKTTTRTHTVGKVTTFKEGNKNHNLTQPPGGSAANAVNNNNNKNNYDSSSPSDCISEEAKHRLRSVLLSALRSALPFPLTRPVQNAVTSLISKLGRYDAVEDNPGLVPAMMEGVGSSVFVAGAFNKLLKEVRERFFIGGAEEIRVDPDVTNPPRQHALTI